MKEKAKKGVAKPTAKGVCEEGKAPAAEVGKKSGVGIREVEDRAAPRTRTNIACE